MEKRIKNIARNLGDLPTYSNAANDRVVNFEDYEDHILDLISSIYEDVHNISQVLRSLAKMRNLFHLEIPLSLRPALFRQLNSLTGTLMASYVRDENMYQCCFETLTLFKMQIDAKPQTDEDLSALEYDELEKSVYLLCDWEDHAESAEPAMLELD